VAPTIEKEEPTMAKVRTWVGLDVPAFVIPGHERAAEELVADKLVVEDAGLAISYRGVCGYGSTFDYAG
jgi:hypothetical protein